MTMVFRKVDPTFSSSAVNIKSGRIPPATRVKRHFTHPMRSLLICCSLLIWSHLRAEPSPQQLDIGGQVASLMDYKAMFQGFEHDCRAQTAPEFNPSKMFEANANAFGGITPRSLYWPRIEAIYRQYLNSVCSLIVPDDLNEIFGKQLASRLSESDLKATLAFFSTKAGQNLQHAMISVNEEHRRRIQTGVGVSSTPYQEASKALSAVLQEYQRVPK